MRRLGIVAGVVLLLFVALLVAGYVALQQIDWNEYKQPISEAALDATGRRLDLGGDIDLQIGLQPGVRLEGIRFANADWGSRPDMAVLDHVLVRFRLLPLLSGELEVSRVVVEGLELLLETREDGVANWDFAARDGESPAPAAPAAEDEVPEDELPSGETAGKESSEAAEPLALFLQRAEIKDAVVVIRDGATGDEQRVAVDRMLAKASAPGAPLSLDLEMKYGAEPIRLTGEIEGLRGLMAGGSLDLDLAVEAGGASVSVVGNVAEPLEAAVLDLDLTFETARLGRLSALTGSELPDLGPIAVELNLSGGGDRYEIRDLDLEVGSTKIGGTVDATLGGERPQLDLWLVAPRIDAADLQAPDLGGRSAAPRVSAAPGIQLASTNAGTSTGNERLFSSDPLPLDGLDAVDANLRLDADLVVAGAIELDHFGIQLALANAKLDIQQFGAGLAGGRIDAKVSLDAGRAKPPVSIVGTVRAVSAGQLAAAQGSDVIEEGPVDLDFDLRGRGRSVAEIMASLDGSLELSMGRAVVRDDYAAMALSDLGSIVRQGVSDSAAVECLYGDFQLTDGVARPDGLVIHLTSIALFGEGKIDLGRERMKLKFDRQAQQVAASGALPPFTLKGPLSDPSPGIDTGALVGKVVDLGADLLGSGTERSHETVSGCRELLARYQKEQKERGSTADVARKAAGDLGGKAGETSKKVLDKFKGFFK